MTENLDATGKPKRPQLIVFDVNETLSDMGGMADQLAAHGVHDVEAAVHQSMGAFTSLAVHDDVTAGVRALTSEGIRLVTLSNGSTAVAQGLFERNGIEGSFERLLSVQGAPAWKPARAAYEYALGVCDVAPGDAMLVAVHPRYTRGTPAVHPRDVHGAPAWRRPRSGTRSNGCCGPTAVLRARTCGRGRAGKP